MADVNYYSISNQAYVKVEGIKFPSIDINALDYDDILKISRSNNVVIKKCNIFGGREDCVDMNNYCSNILIEDVKVHSGGKYCFTIKGGSRDITLKDIVVEGHGKEVDIDIGNWSDQSSELTTNVILENVTSLNGTPVTVRVLWADKPTIIGGNIKLKVIPKIFVRIYRFLRSLRLVP